MVLLDTFTNGPDDQPWDSWVRSFPKPSSDTRNGPLEKLLEVEGTVHG